MMNKAYVDYLVAEHKSKRTIDTYVNYIEKALAFIGKPDSEITRIDLMNWQNSISHLSANSINLQISAIKSYFGFLYEMDIINSNPAEKMKKLKNNPKVKPFISSDDISKMIAAAKSDRNKAIVSTLAMTGLRISELKSIRLDSYKANSNEIIIVGKGNKQRKVYIPSVAQKYINIYLENRTVNSEFLFCSRTGTEIDTNKVDDSIKRIAKNAGLDYWETMSAHCLRSAFCSNMLANNVPVNVVRDMMGHASIATTNIYAKSSQEMVKNYMMMGY